MIKVSMAMVFEKLCFYLAVGWLYTVSNLTRENKERTVSGLINFCGA